MKLCQSTNLVGWPGQVGQLFVTVWTRLVDITRYPHVWQKMKLYSKYPYSQLIEFVMTNSEPCEDYIFTTFHHISKTWSKSDSPLQVIFANGRELHGIGDLQKLGDQQEIITVRHKIFIDIDRDRNR